MKVEGYGIPIRITTAYVEKAGGNRTPVDYDLAGWTVQALIAEGMTLRACCYDEEG